MLFKPSVAMKTLLHVRTASRLALEYFIVHHTSIYSPLYRYSVLVEDKRRHHFNIVCDSLEKVVRNNCYVIVGIVSKETGAVSVGN